MGSHQTIQTPSLKPFTTPNSVKSLAMATMLLGALTFLVGVFTKNDRVWTAFLVAFFYFASLSLGGLFFTAIQHVTNAGWSVTVRRVSESFVAFLPVAAVAAVVIFLGSKKLYMWMNPAIVSEDSILQAKTGYLNGTFWIIRWVLFFGLWMWFAKLIVGRSLEQDKTGDANLTLKNLGTSVKFLLFFALSYSFFSVDALMSLQPHWFSTIWGVYCFAGLFQSTIAFLIILIVWLMKNGSLNGFVNENHLHDLGKFLKAFTIFYAYIGFSQFMLIWYANLPEETEFYLERMHGGWLYVSIALAVFKFIVPFLALLPRAAKRNPAHLVAVSLLVLAAHYLDVYWIVYPNFNDNALVFSFWEILVFLGFLGAFVLMVTRFLSKNNIVPIKDPRLHESLAHEVVY